MKQWKSRTLNWIMFSFAVMVMVIAFISNSKTTRNGEITRITDGWTIKYNNTEVYEDVNLDEFRGPMAMRGDWIVCSVKLPDDLPSNITMSFHMVFSVVQAYIDGERIFEYGLDDYEKGVFLGYGSRNITIPDNSAGKTLKITLYVTEDNAFSSIATPIIYDEGSVIETIYAENLGPFAISVALVVVGLCITLITFALYFKSYTMERLFSIGIFAMCIGLWTLCNYNLDVIFTSSIRVKSYVEYFSFYLILFPLILYFRSDVEKRQNRVESFIYYALLFIEIQLFCVAAITQLLGVCHLPTFARLYRAFMCVVGAFICYLVVKDLILNKNHRILAIGVGVLLAIGYRDILVFDLNKFYGKYGTANDFESYSAAGALIFVTAMLVDFILEMREAMFKVAETKFLEKIAYEDVLTNLYTRRKCEEVFDEIDKRGFEYAIIQFDLNNLKTTNDEFGHEMGDALITRFADTLRLVFNEGEVLGRMGGDEFIVMIKDAYGYDVDDKLKQFDEEIDKCNEENQDVKVSASYGYCRSSELSKPKARNVYMEADKRMYVAKEKYYKKMGYKRRKNDKT